MQPLPPTIAETLARDIALLGIPAPDGYEGKPLAAMQGLDQDGRIIYAGTFSKVLFPSNRAVSRREAWRGLG
jgi:hypothetical protein